MLHPDLLFGEDPRQVENRVFDVVTLGEGGVEFVFVHDGLGLLITLEDEAEDETDESERLRQPFLPVDAGVLQFLQKPGIFAV